jgi:hypothetical protein
VWSLTGILGLVFAFVDINNHFRCVLRLKDDCFVLEQRSNSTTFTVLAQATTASFPDLSASFDMHVVYGNGSIEVFIVDTVSQETLNALHATVPGVDMTGQIGCFSAHNSNGAQFLSLLVVDESFEARLTALTTTSTSTAAPATAMPTPAPTAANVDCQLSPWSSWSFCSESCRTDYAGGTQSATRVVTVAPSGSGAACGPLSMVQSCNLNISCAPPCNLVGCSMTEITGSSTWCRCCLNAGLASCANSTSIFQRSGCVSSGWCQLLPTGLAKYCGPDQLPNTTFCAGIIPVACEVSAWSQFSQCSAACAPTGSVLPGVAPNGTMTRTRQITVQAQLNGTACPALTDTQPCNTSPCAVDCLLSSWSPWTTCTGCNGTLASVNSTTSQTRTVVVAPAYNGSACEALTQQQPCYITCDLDCFVSPWSAWGTCVPNSNTCGVGNQSRTRVVTQTQSGNGQPCDPLAATSTCFIPCPVDCVVSSWSTPTCDRACGDGTETTTRAVVTPAAAGGAPCPALTQVVLHRRLYFCSND